MNKTTALKMIDHGNKRDSRQFYVYVAEHDGRRWATNGFWLAPAEWFAVVLGDDPKLGTHDAKGGWVSEDVPNIERLFPTEELPIIESLRMHGHDVLLDRGDKGMGALFVHESGAETMLDAAYVRMFHDAVDAKNRYGVQVRFRQLDPLKCAVVEQSSNYTRAHGGNVETWRVIGLLMPIRLADQ